MVLAETARIGLDMMTTGAPRSTVLLNSCIEDVVAAAGNSNGLKLGLGKGEGHRAWSELLGIVLLELGLLQGDRNAIVVSHWLGLDIHDVGVPRLGGSPHRPEAWHGAHHETGALHQQPTTRPGGATPIPDHWQGIVIRIEDDVAVTA